MKRHHNDAHEETRYCPFEPENEFMLLQVTRALRNQILVVQYLEGLKRKNSAILQQRGQFFVLNKTEQGMKKRVLKKKEFEVAPTPNYLTDDYKILGEKNLPLFHLHAKFQQK